MGPKNTTFPYSAIYSIPGLKIVNAPFNAQVEVFRQQHPISRDKPTAFVAGRGYEDSLGPEMPDKVVYKAGDLGTVLGEFYTVITGHCPGVPSYVAKAALENSEVIGVSPFVNSDEHMANWRNSKIYSETGFKLEPWESATIAIHTGLGMWHRDVCNIELTNNHRQHVYVVGGHTGTFHETIVAVAHDAIIGALLGVEGVSNDIAIIKNYLDRYGTRCNIVEDTDPKALVEKVRELDRILKEHENGHKQEKEEITPLKELLSLLEKKILI